jgi:ABC-2 type transport system permease protein
MTTTTLAPARPRLGALTAESTFIARSMRHSLRDVEALLMSVMLPVMLMLMFTWIFGNAIDPSGGYVDYVVPGIILLCAGFGASSTAVSVSRDMTTGIIDRFRTMPLRSGAVLTGHVVASLVRNLFATAVVIAVGLLVGFRPSAGPMEWLGAFGIVALYILAITYLFAAIGLAASTPEAATGYGFILLFLP